ncbi:ATP-binding protein [Schaalia hyovaginalis]|uniref:AlbA family DNA-binding domain-containing protein n=1 Tax=Schaalia hyovaginalis TaxID=29316 RepID=UPI002A7EA7EA|nr:ATP-binding protein [Schaalia hyovaginalis]MDY4493242.1 ATP-binding protein [Schaalia hyovaginalis]
MPETLCAFANMPDGDTVIFGVDEGSVDLTVVGVSDIASLESRIASMARTAIAPAPRISFQTIEMDSKNVVIAHIAPFPLADKPARTRGPPSYQRELVTNVPAEYS